MSQLLIRISENWVKKSSTECFVSLWGFGHIPGCFFRVCKDCNHSLVSHLIYNDTRTVFSLSHWKLPFFQSWMWHLFGLLATYALQHFLSATANRQSCFDNPADTASYSQYIRIVIVMFLYLLDFHLQRFSISIQRFPAVLIKEILQ